MGTEVSVVLRNRGNADLVDTETGEVIVKGRPVAEIQKRADRVNAIWAPRKASGSALPAPNFENTTEAIVPLGGGLITCPECSFECDPREWFCPKCGGEIATLGPPTAVFSATENSGPTTYEMFIDDNFHHYTDADYRWCAGRFDRYEEAVAAAKKIVEDSVLQGYEPGLTADELMSQYRFSGDDPFISPGDFSAWTYSREFADTIFTVEKLSAEECEPGQLALWERLRKRREERDSLTPDHDTLWITSCSRSRQRVLRLFREQEPRQDETVGQVFTEDSRSGAASIQSQT